MSILVRKIVISTSKPSGIKYCVLHELNGYQKYSFYCRNNHDLSVYLCWDPEWCFGSPEESEEAKDLFHQSVGVLKLRTHIVWVVSAAIELVKAKESSKSKCVEILTEKLTKWETDYLAYADKTYSIKEVRIQAVFKLLILSR